MRKIIISIFLLWGYMVVEAQTVVWQMQPTDYSSIERINKNLFKVARNGKIGLINADGTIVAEAVNDELSGFYEHKALMTSNDGNGERIMGCLTDDGRYFPYSEKYYTLSGQKFFSDGVLSVANAQKQLGYIDESGNVVVGFDGKYDKIKPFVEGHAAVFKNKKYYLIDKDGIISQFVFDGVGKVDAGTNVYKGKAYLWDTGGTAYTYDINNENKSCKRTRLPSNKSMDYLYRFSEVTGLSKDIPFVKEKNSGVGGLKPISENGLFGFVSETNTILPCQLSSATQFEDNYSVVSIDGRIGILRYVEGNGFAVSTPTDVKEFVLGKDIHCSFTLSIPTIWRGKELRVIVKESNGTTLEISNIVNTYTFEVTPLETCIKEYTISVYAERLKLFGGTASYKFVRICPTCKKNWDGCHGVHEIEKKSNGNKIDTKGKKEDWCDFCNKPKKDCPKNGIH